MRKSLFFAALMAAVAIIPARAEGYQINTLSAKQLGMGHTGVAQKLGAESMIFNPAGLAFSDRTLDLSGTLTGIKATCTATVDGKDYTTNNGMSTPIAFNAAFRIYDNLQAGVAFYTPYGSAINWTENWPGAVLNQKVKLATYTIQPTVSWRILPNFSVGAGLTMTWGTVDLNKGLVTASTFDKLIATGKLPGVDSSYRFGETTPASVNLNGTADVVLGYNVGLMWDVTDRITLGASYRSKSMMRVKAGEASVTYANKIAEGVLESSLNLINQANFKAEMPCPYVVNVGISWKPIDALVLAFDAQLTGWKAYENLDIEFLGSDLEDFNQHLAKNYRNAWTYKMGAQYSLTERLDLRLGMQIDTTPCNDEHYNPETPGMSKIEPTVGFSFRPMPRLSIDMAFMYVAGLGRDNASCTYKDLLAAKAQAMGFPAQAFPAMATFKADYKLHALVPSIGISYSF